MADPVFDPRHEIAALAGSPAFVALREQFDQQREKEVAAFGLSAYGQGEVDTARLTARAAYWKGVAAVLDEPVRTVEKLSRERDKRMVEV